MVMRISMVMRIRIRTRKTEMRITLCRPCREMIRMMIRKKDQDQDNFEDQDGDEDQDEEDWDQNQYGDEDQKMG